MKSEEKDGTEAEKVAIELVSGEESQKDGKTEPISEKNEENESAEEKNGSEKPVLEQKEDK